MLRGRIIAVPVLLLVFVGGAYLIFKIRPLTATPTRSPIVEVPAGESLTPAQESLKKWEDPNGFSFQYPASLAVDAHDEDETNYAHVEFTNPTYPGSVIVWAKDTKLKTAASWAKSTYPESSMLDTTMDERPATKILVNAPKKQMISAIIDDGIIFYVEGNLEHEYWSKVQTEIASSFQFTYMQSSREADDPEAAQVSFDEEESVE